MNPENRSTFDHGVKCFAANCRSAVQLVKSGRWTIEQMDKWLKAVIDSDPAYLKKAKGEILENRILKG